MFRRSRTVAAGLAPSLALGSALYAGLAEVLSRAVPIASPTRPNQTCGQIRDRRRSPTRLAAQGHWYGRSTPPG